MVALVPDISKKGKITHFNWFNSCPNLCSYYIGLRKPVHLIPGQVIPQLVAVCGRVAGLVAAAEERHVVEDDGRRGRNGHRQIPDLALLAYKVVVMLDARTSFCSG